MKINTYTVSAFCKDNRGGNLAGVVLSAEGLDETQKKAISNKLGYSETAFVTQSNIADFKLEYFTPVVEVPLCGHATIATFALMQHLGLLDQTTYSFESKAGVLEITINEGKIFMEQSRPHYADIIEKAELATCFDIDYISEEYPIQIVSTGLPDLLVPIKDEQRLRDLTPNFEEIAKISHKYDIVGIHAFVLQDDRIICRNFAPLYDIPEESATGTANCALVSYLYKHEIKRSPEYTIEQGESLNLPSEITVRITCDNDEISRIFVGGYGYFVKEMDVYITDDGVTICTEH